MICMTKQKRTVYGTVPVDIDAILFWKVLDSKKSALEIAGYQAAITPSSFLIQPE